VAAAAVVGVVAIQPGSHAPTQSQPTVSHGPVSPKFTTVAQVVDAAAANSPDVDPTASPYWKVVTGTQCGDATTTFACAMTIWTGNDRPGAIKNGAGEVWGTCPGTVTVEGRTMSWAEANSRHRSAAEVASMVADNGADQPGRPAHSFYVFKNAIELLGGAPAAQEIRKELWRELASVPGVTLEGRQKDELGRTGWRLTLNSGLSGYGSQSVLVDTSTGSLLESRDWVTGHTPNVSTIVSAGPDESVPQTSPGQVNMQC
jgi:hypothetical protein